MIEPYLNPLALPEDARKVDGKLKLASEEPTSTRLPSMLLAWDVKFVI